MRGRLNIIYQTKPKMSIAKTDDNNSIIKSLALDNLIKINEK